MITNYVVAAELLPRGIEIVAFAPRLKRIYKGYFRQSVVVYLDIKESKSFPRNVRALSS